MLFYKRYNLLCMTLTTFKSIPLPATFEANLTTPVSDCMFEVTFLELIYFYYKSKR